MNVFALLKLAPSLPPSIQGCHSNLVLFSFYYILSSRSILAALHFNYNLKRDVKLDAEGKSRLRVTFPKYKEGEGTVREARVPANYGN